MKAPKQEVFFAVSVLFVLILLVIVRHYHKKKEILDNSSNPCAISPYLVNETKEDSLGVQFVIDPKYIWNNRRTIKVYFLDSNKNLPDKTLTIANEWLEQSIVKFVKVNNLSESDIRVAFRRGGGQRSLIGTEAAELKYLGLPTMWLDNLDQTPDMVFRRTVLHEFGHALGLLHELQNPNAKFHWNVNEVRAYFRALLWKDADITKNILNPPSKRVISSSYDPNSIMIYQIPSRLLKNNQAILWPKGLSANDKNYINKYY